MTTLFDPITIGELELKNRIIMAPLTRCRADAGRVPNALMAEYYVQRASAGLIISEATSVTPMGVGYPDTPGIWSDDQVRGWSGITQAVHANGGKIVLQLWHVGRISDPSYLDGELPVAPSAIAAKGHVSLIRPMKDYVTPRALETAEIADIVEAYRQGAENAKAAGFDGVEIHGANGYLLDQFLQDSTNQRTDQYGGSFENRIRLPMEVFKAVREAFGGTLGMRISGTDWVDGGWTVEETAELSVQLKQAGAQFVHISSGGVSPLQKIALGPEYQVHLAKAVKAKSDLTTIAVGLITEPAQAEAVLQRGDADLVALARSFLYKPRWGWEAAVALGGTVDAQHQYWRSLPREAKNIFNDAKIGMR